jgi:putative transposase
VKDVKLEDLYCVAGITRQAFHKYCNRKIATDNIEKEMLEKVKLVRKNHFRMGSRPLYYAAKIMEVGINKFERFMSNQGLTIKQKRRRTRTTIAGPGSNFPNKINGLILNGINQVISGDITYYWENEKLYYIFTLKDLYSKRIVGLVGSDNMKALNAMKAFKQVIELRGIENLKSMIHHTDRGSQYKSNDYNLLLKSAKIDISMAYSCLENGSAEQLNGILKNDYLENLEVRNVKDLNKKLRTVMYLINEEKPVKALKYLTPVAFENKIKGLSIEEKPKFKLYDFEQNSSKGEFFLGIPPN